MLSVLSIARPSRAFVRLLITWACPVPDILRPPLCQNAADLTNIPHCMQELVILSRLEEEQLVRAVEGGQYVQFLRQLFTWCQGALRALLPHGILVCLRLTEDDQLLQLECLNNRPLEAGDLRRLCDPEDGLAIRLARACRDMGQLSLRLGSDEAVPEGGKFGASADGREAHLAPLREELRYLRLSNVLVHGTERLPGGATFFALFDLSSAPTARHEFFLALMLPHLHLAFLRVIANRDGGSGMHTSPVQALSGRELEVLTYAIRGKTNAEIALILGLSMLTVKNHLQKIYRKLNVHNRVQALARANELRLLAPAATRAARPTRSVLER